MATDRALLARFFHETNTFAQERTDRADFEAEGDRYGEAVTAYFRGTETEVAGAVDVADEAGVDLVPTVAAEATPGGIVTRDAYEHYTDHILDAVCERAAELDGVLLVLHGAMVPEGGADGEGPLIAGVREIVGPAVPIVATLDLHGNVTDEMVREADALVAYETHPHLDKRETGRTGMRLLVDAMRGDVDLETVVERPPVLPHAPFQNTAREPMASVAARARELEARDSVLKASVLPGFHRADVPEMGFSIPVVSDGDPAEARAAARDLAALVWERRSSFVGDYPTPAEAVAEARRLVGQKDPDDGPVVMADFGPQPGGGGSADGTATLRALLAAGVENAGYAIMRDPEAVAACVRSGAGERVTLTLGGKTDDRHGDPIADLDGYVKAITDGRYVNTGTSHRGTGTEERMGTTVRLQCGSDDGVAVVVTENRTPPFDREVWRHVGIPPARLDVIVVTSTTAFRGDYEPIASHVVEVDSPGVASPLPERFEYDRLRRPKFPIDEMADDAYPDWHDGGDP